MPFEPALLGPVCLFLGALVGGSASLLGVIYAQRCQGRLQRVASEIAKRETVYADFVMSASNLLLNAYTCDEIALGGDEQRLIGCPTRRITLSLEQWRRRTPPRYAAPPGHAVTNFLP